MGVGSNIDAAANINKALIRLSELSALLGSLEISPVYKNAAQGFVGADFLNLVVGFETYCELSELIGVTDQVERHCGRCRELEIDKGSRSLDLDLLIYGDFNGEYQGRQLPRPDVYSRQFVWQPLLDLLARKQELSDFELTLKADIESQSQVLQASLFQCSSQLFLPQ